MKVIHNWNTQTVNINLKTNVLLVRLYRRPDKSGLKSKARGRFGVVHLNVVNLKPLYFVIFPIM